MLLNQLCLFCYHLSEMTSSTVSLKLSLHTFLHSFFTIKSQMTWRIFMSPLGGAGGTFSCHRSVCASVHLACFGNICGVHWWIFTKLLYVMNFGSEVIWLGIESKGQRSRFQHDQGPNGWRPTVYSGELSLLPFTGREMSSSLRATVKA